MLKLNCSFIKVLIEHIHNIYVFPYQDLKFCCVSSESRTELSECGRVSRAIMSIQLNTLSYPFYLISQTSPDKKGTTKGKYLDGWISLPSSWAPGEEEEEEEEVTIRLSCQESSGELSFHPCLLQLVYITATGRDRAREPRPDFKRRDREREIIVRGDKAGTGRQSEENKVRVVVVCSQTPIQLVNNISLTLNWVVQQQPSKQSGQNCKTDCLPPLRRFTTERQEFRWESSLRQLGGTGGWAWAGGRRTSISTSSPPPPGL